MIKEDPKNRHLMMINSSISKFLIKENGWYYRKSQKNRKLRAIWDEFIENKRNSMFFYENPMIKDDPKNPHLMMINSSISKFLIKENEWNNRKSQKNRKLQAILHEFVDNKRNSMFFYEIAMIEWISTSQIHKF